MTAPLSFERKELIISERQRFYRENINDLKININICAALQNIAASIFLGLGVLSLYRPSDYLDRCLIVSGVMIFLSFMGARFHSLNLCELIDKTNRASQEAKVALKEDIMNPAETFIFRKFVVIPDYI